LVELAGDARAARLAGDFGHARALQSERAVHHGAGKKNGANKGAIYLWTTRFATANGEIVPRAFQIPFSPELQLKVASAGTKLRKRMPQLGEVVPGKPAAGGHGAGAIDLNFFDMPDPLFPER